MFQSTLISGPYLIVITSKVKVGDLKGHPIWKVTGTEMLPYKRTTMHLNEQQVQGDTIWMV